MKQPTPIEGVVQQAAEEITTRVDAPKRCPACKGHGGFGSLTPCETCHGLGVVEASQVEEKIPGKP